MDSLVPLLSSTGWLLLTLGILVSFHEWGHYLAARAFRIDVLRFSVGFGRALWEKRMRNGVVLAVGWIPLGGYVRMLDTRQDDVAPERAGRAYDRQKPWKRMVVAAAGPLANVVFAMAAFWTMGVLGTPDFIPVLGTPTGAAADAGLEEGDRITAIDGRPIKAWSEAIFALGAAASTGKEIPIQVMRDGQPVEAALPPAGGTQGQPGDIGISLKPVDTAPVVREAREGFPAQEAGVIAGDRLVAINGRETVSFIDFGRVLQEETAKSPDIIVDVRRGNDTMRFPVQARREVRGDTSRWIIGVTGPDPHNTVLRFNPVEAAWFAWRTTGDTLSITANVIGNMVTGKASRDNLSGPVGIAQEARQSAGMGVSWFLRFLGLISLSLAIMNLLPLPVLDGGHILLDAVEIIRGRPATIRFMVAFQQTGIGVLMALMGLALWNDMARLIG